MIGVILAAGRGARMAPYSNAVCKEMLPVGDAPIIEYTARYLAGAGVGRVYVVLRERKEEIIRYLRNGRRLGVDIAYVFQDDYSGVGTAKAVEAVEPWVGEDFIVCYGDTFFHPGVFMRDMIMYHRDKGSDVTIGLYPIEDPEGFGVVRLDGDGCFLELVEKPGREEAERLVSDGVCLVNSSPIIFTPQVFRYIGETKPSPSGEYYLTDTINMMKGDGRRVYGYHIPRGVFWRDIGTPRARLEAERHFLDTVLSHEAIRP